MSVFFPEVFAFSDHHDSSENKKIKKIKKRGNLLHSQCCQAREAFPYTI
jgi:hypothetical protein